MYMNPTQNKQNRLDGLKQKIRGLKDKVLESYKISIIGIFGSYVRGENTEKSDLDILIDFQTDATLMDWIELEEYLNTELGIKVDLIPQDALKPKLKPTIEKELVLV